VGGPLFEATANLLAIEAGLALYGFIVVTEGKDGASENRSETKNRSTLTLRHLCAEKLMIREEDGSDSNHYTEHELPWDLPLAHPHPSVKDVIIVQSGDAPHTIKKMRNSIELSGKEDSNRNLHLNGLPIQLRMAKDVWERCPDATAGTSSQIMLYPKLSREVFDLTAKTRMRTGLAARAQGASVAKMIVDYRHTNTERAGDGAYDSYLLHCVNTNYWFDVMNANYSKGCSFINSADHQHVYDLLDYVKYHTLWKNSVSANEYFPRSTYEDVCWSSLGPALLAILYLPKHPGHNIMQSRLGSDVCEKSFCFKRGANMNANALGTNQILASFGGGPLNEIWASRKANFQKRRTFRADELLLGKLKRIKLDK
jgi:hypothetical protein